MEVANVDLFKEAIQKEIDLVKKEQELMKTDIRNQSDKMIVLEQRVGTIETDLKDIKDDTKWIRRAITNAIIGTIVSGVLGGAIGIIFLMIQK